MKKILVVIDMQYDFIVGTLGTKEAQEIVGAVIEKIGRFEEDCIYATLDTHGETYLETKEGSYLPVVHCVKETKGWALDSAVEKAMPKAIKIHKSTFGSMELAQVLYERSLEEEIEIELVGLCTDICVVTNALILKTKLPTTTIKVDALCCAGVTKESHDAALVTMQMCQVEVYNRNKKNT